MPDEDGSRSGKVFVVDTSTFMYAPECADPLRAPFGDNEVVIPITVLRELDGLKTDVQHGRDARMVNRIIDKTFLNSKSTREGVKTAGGGIMRIVGANGGDFALPKEYAGNTNDDFILRVAGNLQSIEQAKEAGMQRRVILITKDVSLRTKARAAGIEASDLKTGKVDRPEALAPRIAEINAPSELIDELYQNGSIAIDGLELPYGLHLNACCRLSDPEGSKQALSIFVPGDRMVVVHKSRMMDKGKRGVSPRNAEQLFAYTFAMRQEILSTILVGVAGTGKTLMALKAGIDLLETPGSSIKRIICFRPMIEIGPKLGYLPGDVSEKYAPWARAIYSNLHLLFAHQTQNNGDNGHNGEVDKQNGADSKKNGKQQGKHVEPKEKLDRSLKSGAISVEPFTHIRGTTLPGSFIIVDEAQNLTPHEIKAILTRTGEGSRVVLTGDLSQIDNPNLDAASCGLAKALERMKGHPSFGAIELIKGERSRLATLIAELFADL